VSARVLRLAAFVVLTVVLTAWIGRNIDGGGGGSRYELVATFDDVAGMYDGDEVKLAGLAVGEVTDIEVVDGRARVRFSVDESVTLPSDSTVKVRWRNLIGQRYLALEPGEATAVLADGDTVANARNVVDLGQLVNQLVPLARTVSPDQINTILTTTLEAFEGNDENFDELVTDLGTVLATLAERDSTISQLLTDYDAVAEALGSRDAQVGQMVDNLLAISETFAGNDALLDQALVELAQLSGGLDQLLTTSAGDLGLAIEHLGTLIGIAGDNVDVLESGLDQLPPMFETLLTTVSRGEWLRVSVLCITPLPGPCPTPVSVSGDGGLGPLVIDPGGVLGPLLEGLGLEALVSPFGFEGVR